MKRMLSGICTATLTAMFMLGAPAVSAHAQVSGDESFDGKLVTHSDAAGNRTVLASVVRMNGVFKGVGHIVERDNLPTDPENVNRDDLVFRQGTVHFVNTQTSFDVTVNPRSCVLHFVIEEVSNVVGGTGVFANASGSLPGTLHAMAVADRNPDHSCSMELPLLFELDNVEASGTLTL
jgi:hypothetical protein